jgi:diguanylate cyclase (GGDEF)-like protein/PAS domain S-box-containing protein
MNDPVLPAGPAILHHAPRTGETTNMANHELDMKQDEQPPHSEPVLAAISDLGRSFYRELLDFLDDGVYFVDRERRLLFWNKAAEELTGFARSEVVGRLCPDNILCHADVNGRILCTDGCPLEQVMTTGKSKQVDVFLHHKDGYRVPVRVKATPILDAQGRAVGAMEVFNDRTARIEQAERIKELERLALVDELTRLPNRRHFNDALGHRLAEWQRHGRPFGVLMMDVDRFKQVNDECGHLLADAILKLVARTLQANCRSFDIVARWGGEEFGAIISQVDVQQLVLVAEKFRAMVAASDLRLPGQDFCITISVGATTAQANDTVMTLLKRADQALYQAKHQGRNRVCVG